MKLAGQCAIVTGASQGLGFEIARHFVLEGANVVLCARNKNELFEAQNKLNCESTHSKVIALPTDVTDVKQMEDLFNYTLSELGKLDLLVANAGIYGAKGRIDETDWQEWSNTIDINLKGTVIQCKTVLPYFKNKRSGKIIILSGGGATKPLPYLSAYAASKAAVVRFAETLAEETKEFNIDVNTVAPGSLNTRFLDEILSAGPEKVGKKFYDLSLKQKKEGGAPLEIAASLCTFLASSVSNGITGKLISALWDPWQNFPEYIDKLKNSDVYTLRRIIPEDRDEWKNFI